MKLNRLPPRQRECLKVIHKWYEEPRSRGPYLREIAEAMSRSKEVTSHHVEILVARGYLRRIPMRRGSIEITPTGKALFI